MSCTPLPRMEIVIETRIKGLGGGGGGGGSGGGNSYEEE
jgi:hypothetical protein